MIVPHDVRIQAQRCLGIGVTQLMLRYRRPGMRAEGQSLQRTAESLGIGYGTVRERPRGGLAEKPSQQDAEKAPD